MNLSIIGGSNHMDRRLNLSNRTSTSMNTTLNPNAAEFVPSFHRSSNGSGSGSTTGTGVGNPNAPEFIPASLKSPDGNGNAGNTVTAILDRSESSVSTNSEEEAHKYWRVQLPDDITPDFRATGEDEIRTAETISLSRLSINEGGLEPPVLSPSLADNGNRSLWGKPFTNVGKSSMNGREVNGFNGSASPVNQDFIGGSIFSPTEDSTINPIKFLSLKYPGLSSQTLTDIYLRSGQNLSLALEILAEMESQKLNSKSFCSPNMTALGSPANGMYSRSLSTTIRGGDADLSSPLGEAVPSWRYRGDGSSLAMGSLGSGRITRNLSYNGTTEDMASGGLGSPWLESGDSTASMHLESKEELRNLALLRNVCLEQARQAYLAGNDALSKELTLKGQLYNMQIKAAQDKAKEAASQYRSLLLGEVHGFGQENLDRPIDLRGLHASEAIHVLNYELSNIRRTIRSTGRRLEVTILVGPGGNNLNRGVRTPPRLSGAVEQYLFEHGFRCTQTQPGVLSVMIF